MTTSNTSKTASTTKKYPVQSLEAQYQRGLLDAGNPDRLLKAMRKAQNGEVVTMVALGGSITERYAASAQDKAYGELVAAWWRSAFPKSELKFYNAGIASSGTHMAVHRIVDDVLPYAPDVVLVDFAVNDGIGMESSEYYESMLRRLLNSQNKPGLICIFFCRSDGSSTQSQQVSVAKRYNLPMLSYKDAAYYLVELGLWKWSKLSPDTVHPNNYGHQLASDLIVRYLEEVREKLPAYDGKVDATLGTPLTPTRFEDAFKVDAANLSRQSAHCRLISMGGFVSPAKTGGKMPFSWVAQNTAEPLVFEVTGRSVQLIYRCNDANGGVATVKVNGREVGTLDAGQPWDFGNFVIAPYNAAGTDTYRVEIQMTDRASSGDVGKNGKHNVMQLYYFMIDPT